MQHPTLTVQTVSMAARANLFCDLTPSLYTTNNIASKKKKPPLVLFLSMHLWCHTSTMMMMTSKNMKKWPTAAGYKKIKNSSFHIIQHWPSKRCSINDCCLWIKKSKRNHAKIHQEFKKEQSKTSIAAAKKKIPSINEQPLST